MPDRAWLSVQAGRSLRYPAALFCRRSAASGLARRNRSASKGLLVRRPRTCCVAGMVLATVLCWSLGGTVHADDNPSPLSASATFKMVEDGQGVLTVTMDIHRIWHIYSITQPEGGPLPTKITVVAPSGVKVGPFIAQTKPEVYFDQVFEMNIEIHHGRAVWTAPVTFEGVLPQRLTGMVTAQACKVGACLPPTQYSFAADVVSE